MSTTPEIPRQVTREMIEAHYKSVMATALTLLSQDCVALAQNLLSEAIRLPYPIPAPASMPEAAGRENVVSWSTEEVKLLVDYFHNSDAPSAHPALQEQTTAQTARLIDADLASFARAYCAMRAAQTAYFKTRSREDLINSKRLEKALDKAAAIVAADVAGTIRRGTP